MTALIKTGVPRIAARANWGRWVVDCPRVRSHALQMEPGEPLFVCWSCGQVAEVLWPSEPLVYGIERLLMLRPDESTRNWLPGETLNDLTVENAAHGVFSELDPDLSGHVLVVDDGGIRVDRLPSPARPFLRAVSA